MIDKGTILRVQTNTKQDVFGDCLYEVVEVGLTIPDPADQNKMCNDGVKCLMLGGSGPSARAGFTVMDTEATIQANIASGITNIVPSNKKDAILALYGDNSKDGTPRSALGMTGVVEVDM